MRAVRLRRAPPGSPARRAHRSTRGSRAAIPRSWLRTLEQVDRVPRDRGCARRRSSRRPLGERRRASWYRRAGAARRTVNVRRPPSREATAAPRRASRAPPTARRRGTVISRSSLPARQGEIVGERLAVVGRQRDDALERSPPSCSMRRRPARRRRQALGRQAHGQSARVTSTRSSNVRGARRSRPRDTRCRRRSRRASSRRGRRGIDAEVRDERRVPVDALGSDAEALADDAAERRLHSRRRASSSFAHTGCPPPTRPTRRASESRPTSMGEEMRFHQPWVQDIKMPPACTYDETNGARDAST